MSGMGVCTDAVLMVIRYVLRSFWGGAWVAVVGVCRGDACRHAPHNF